MTFTTRFAPSPTGPLHLGHAYSALRAYESARAASGKFLLRIEDIDQSRARPEWESLIYDDLSWLSLDWEQPVMRQSGRLPAYSTALHNLWDLGLLYPCTCNRRDIEAAISAPQEGVPAPFGPDGIIYPGTCRCEIPDNTPFPINSVLRLSMNKAFALLENLDFLNFEEIGAGPNNKTGIIQFEFDELVENIGDIVLARHGIGTSYHLSVVVDDAAQNISHVIRGEDLFEATKIHVLLQKLLKLPTPVYRHHQLVRDENGKRLAKRDDARSLQKYREDGVAPQDIRKMINL